MSFFFGGLRFCIQSSQRFSCLQRVARARAGFGEALKVAKDRAWTLPTETTFLTALMEANPKLWRPRFLGFLLGETGRFWKPPGETSCGRPFMAS